MSDIVDLTIHINEEVSHEMREEIQDEIRDMHGVMIATSRDEQPHFLMVGYDPEITSSRAIVDCVKGQGMLAQIIGL